MNKGTCRPLPRELGPEQLEEFRTEPLGRFAAAWLDFQHSSPCTGQNKKYQYFTAPGEDSAEERDILYGMDRGLAYKRLLSEFNRCRKQQAFAPLFGPGCTKYWESASLPGLVVLASWLDEALPAPGLYTGSFRDMAPERYDHIWLVVRGLKEMPKNPLGNIEWVPELSPSKPLWLHYLDLKKAGKWDRGSFMQDYAPRFLKEMLQPGSYAKLKELAALAEKESVLLCCYCRDESLCHRSLLRLIYGTMKTGQGAPAAPGP